MRKMGKMGKRKKPKAKPKREHQIQERVVKKNSFFFYFFKI